MADNPEQGHGSADAWQRHWERVLQELACGAADPGRLFTELARELATASSAGQGPEEFREVMTACLERWRESLPPEREILEIVRGVGSMQRTLAPWLSVADSGELPWPALGPLQHEQQRLERLAGAAAAHRRATLGLVTDISEILDEAVDAYEALIDSHRDADLRTRLDVWAQAAEERYEARMAEERYAGRFAELANTWAELRLAAQDVLDPMLEALGLPSRRALEDTQRHVVRVERRLDAELARLEEELSRLRGGSSP